MSAYSDWKCGAISDEEYSYECRREEMQDRALEEKDSYSEENCEYYKDGVCECCGQLCNGCE